MSESSLVPVTKRARQRRSTDNYSARSPPATNPQIPSLEFGFTAAVASGRARSFDLPIAWLCRRTLSGKLIRPAPEEPHGSYSLAAVKPKVELLRKYWTGYYERCCPESAICFFLSIHDSAARHRYISEERISEEDCHGRALQALRVAEITSPEARFWRASVDIKKAIECAKALDSSAVDQRETLSNRYSTWIRQGTNSLGRLVKILEGQLKLQRSQAEVCGQMESRRRMLKQISETEELLNHVRGFLGYHMLEKYLCATDDGKLQGFLENPNFDPKRGYEHIRKGGIHDPATRSRIISSLGFDQRPENDEEILTALRDRLGTAGPDKQSERVFWVPKSFSTAQLGKIFSSKSKS